MTDAGSGAKRAGGRPRPHWSRSLRWLLPALLAIGPSWLGPAQAQAQGTPTAPGCLSLGAGNAELNVAWCAPGNNGGSAISNYRVGWSETVAPNSNVPTTWLTQKTDSADTSYTIKGLTNGKRYAVRVQAKNSTNNYYGGLSTTVHMNLPTAVPLAPGAPTVTAGNAAVSLAWTHTDVSGSATTRWQYVKKAGSGDWEASWTDICVTSSDGGCPGRRSFTVTNLNNGTVYKFKVRAVNNVGDGAESPESAAATPVAPTLTAENIERTTATLKLSGHAGVWSYERLEASETCTTVQAGTSTSDLTGLEAGTEYTYWAYGKATCGPTTAVMAKHTFTTQAATTLAASAVEADTATLTITGHTGNWYYKYTAPSGGTCSTDAVTDDDVDLTSLTPGTSYTFKAYSDSGCSTELAAAPAFLTKPGKTTGVTVSPGSAELAVSWTTVTGAASYKVQWKSGNEDWDASRQAAPTGTSHTVTGLTNDTAYTLRVAAVNTTGDGAWSDDATGTPRPITLTATNIGQTTATLALSGRTAKWWYSRQGDDTCVAVAAGTSTADLTGLEADTEYTYRAYSMANCPTSVKIAEHTFETLAVPTLAASDVGADTATLTIANHTGDWYYKYTSPSGGTCSSDAVTDDDVDLTSLTPGTSYTFKAYSDSNCSTEVASAQPFLTKPAKTEGVAVGNRDTELRLSWRAVTSATSYKVQWKSGSESYDASSRQKTSQSTENDYTLGGLTNNTAYTLRVAAVNATGDGAWSADATGTPVAITLAAGPVGPTAARLTLSGFTGQWWYSASGTGLALQCKSVAAGTPSVNLTDLTPETAYTFTAYDASECVTSLYIAEHDFSTPATATLTSSAVEATTATLNIAGHTGNWYYKYTDPSAGTCSTTAVTGLTVDLTDLATGTSYTFKAYVDDKCTMELGAAQAFLTKPGKTTGVTVQSGNARLQVSWSTVTGAASYKLQWKSGNEEWDTTDRQAALTETSHEIPGLTNNTAYTLRVAAVNTTGDGAWSDETTGRPRAAGAGTGDPGVPGFGSAAVADQVYTQDAAIEPLVLPAASGGHGALTYTLTPALPAGLVFDPATRTLSGTPRVTMAAKTYTYTATDASGNAAKLTFRITVAAAVPVLPAAAAILLAAALFAAGRRRLPR